MARELPPPILNRATLRFGILVRTVFTIVGLASEVSLASCSVDARVTLGTGTAFVEADVAVSPQALAAWNSLRELDATLPADPLDPTLLKAGLGPGSSVTADAQATHLKFAVDPRRIAPELSEASGWEIVLDRAAVRRLAALSSWGQSPVLDALVPPAGTSVTEADYSDLLSYMLGLDNASRAILDASTVKLTIRAPRPIQSAPGATVSGSTATYRWPLVRILALETPLRLKLVYER